MAASEDDRLLSQHFDSAGMDADQAFAGWQQAIAPVFDIAPVEPGPSFSARYDTYHLGGVLIGIGQFDPTMFSRCRRKFAADGIDHVLVQVYTRGGYTGVLDDRPITVGRDELVTLDMARETRTIAAASDNITLMIPREFLRGQTIPHGHMAQGPKGAVLGGLLVDHLLALRERLPTMQRSVGAAVAEITLSLYRAALDPLGEAGEAAAQPIREALFHRARRLIDTRLGEEIEAGSLAQALGISRSTLYRLFEPHRGVASFVLERRLASVRKALRDPQDGRRIGTIAAQAGFSDASHFSRVFRRRFGMTPAEMRKQGSQAPLRSDAGTDFDLRPWIKDLFG